MSEDEISLDVKDGTDSTIVSVTHYPRWDKVDRACTIFTKGTPYLSAADAKRLGEVLIQIGDSFEEEEEETVPKYQEFPLVLADRDDDKVDLMFTTKDDANGTVSFYTCNEDNNAGPCVFLNLEQTEELIEYLQRAAENARGE